MRVNRKKLLGAVEAASAAVSKDGAIDQSDFLLFERGKLRTYNDFLACSLDSPLDIDGAVKAFEFNQLLRKLTEDELEITVKPKYLEVVGDSRKAKVAMQKSVRLQVEVDAPERWGPLPREFADAVRVVLPCTSSSKSSKFVVRCVRLGAEGMSATDNVQLVHASIGLPTSNPFLVLPDVLDHAAILCCDEMGVTEKWVHFRNASGVMLSGRRHDLTFPPFREVLKTEGKKTKLPEGLKEAIDRAFIFAEGSTKDARIKIAIKGDRVRISGKGPHGEYLEEQETSSRMKASFYTTPQLMNNLLKKSTHCEVVPGRMLIVRGDYYDYATSLVLD